MYRATPLQNGFAPSELLMGRKLNTKLPSLQRSLHVKPNLPSLIEKEQRYRDNQRDNYNRRHSVQKAPELQPGDAEYIKDLKRPGSIINRHPNPCSYIVNTEQGTIRRNHAHLVATPTPARSPQALTPSVPEASPRPPSVPRTVPSTTSETSPEMQPSMPAQEHSRLLALRHSVNKAQ
ncbi:Pol polyprotein [Elysia marginata]|uniref:Pol polyprotein n=1 Tax=Elysia marginata TaxID=1093978 RepID=A0AAV4JLJ3_9GAST|nr:Pol polyprotein [Elysia marginata]